MTSNGDIKDIFFIPSLDAWELYSYFGPYSFVSYWSVYEHACENVRISL
jgi:hypothetical protein